MRPGDERRAAELDRLRRALYAPGVPPGAPERYREALATTALPARAAAPPRSRRRAPTIALLAAVVGAAFTGALVGTPAPHSVQAARTALLAPPTAGTRVWTDNGVGSLPSSPVLEAPGSPVVVALACRGRGAVLVLVDQQVRRVPCAAGRVRRDTEYFVGHHGRFTVALSLSAPVEWALTVTAVEAG